MKKNRIIIFVLLIVFLLIILSKSGILTSVMNNSRLEKIDNYSISHELSFLDTEKELEQLYLKNNFKKDGYIYNITQLETMTIESANDEYFFGNNRGLYPEASYYIFRNDDRAYNLLSISTSKNGIIRKLEKGSSNIEMTINEYMDGLIQALQNRKDMYTRSRSSLVIKKPDN